MAEAVGQGGRRRLVLLPGLPGAGHLREAGSVGDQVQEGDEARRHQLRHHLLRRGAGDRRRGGADGQGQQGAHAHEPPGRDPGHEDGLDPGPDCLRRQRRHPDPDGLDLSVAGRRDQVRRRGARKVGGDPASRAGASRAGPENGSDEDAVMSTVDVLLQQIVNGLALGMMYALLALGFTMVYGIIELINFSHFSVFMTGTFVGLVVLNLMGVTAVSKSLTGFALVGTLVVLFAATMATTGVLGVLIERICLRSLRHVAGTARMMGIDVDRVVVLTFFLGSALAGAGSLFFGLYYGFTGYYIGYTTGLRAFTSAVLGGIGSIPGAVLGGLFIGLTQSLGGQLVGVKWTDVIIFSLLIVVMVFRPNGLLGAHVPQKA